MLFYKLEINYFEFDYCTFIVVKVAIIWRWKYCYHSWELFLSSPMIHFKSISLCLMSSNNREKRILLQKLFRQFIPKEIWTSSYIIIFHYCIKFSIIIIYWVSPNQVAEQSCFGNFFETVNLLYVIQWSNIWRNSTMDA